METSHFGWLSIPLMPVASPGRSCSPIHAEKCVTAENWYYHQLKKKNSAVAISQRDEILLQL